MPGRREVLIKKIYFTSHSKVTNKRIAVLYKDGSIAIGRDYGAKCTAGQNFIELLEQEARLMGLRPHWLSRAELLCPDCVLPRRQCQCL